MQLKIDCRKIFYVACVAVALFKIWLVSHQEIVAFNFPHDDLWYVKASLESLFRSKYTEMSYINLPSYAMWIAFVNFTGVPLRIATELLYIGSAFYFAVVLHRASFPRWVSWGAFVLVVLHPYSVFQFNRTLAESFYAPILLLALSSLLMLWIRRESRGAVFHAILSGCYFGLLWNTRKESILILLIVLAYSLIVLWWSRAEGSGKSFLLKRLGVQVGVPVAVIAVFALSLDFAHYLKFGLFVPTELNSPGYVAANRALLRIKPVKSIRFVPVTKETRKLAYAVSPAFKELEPYLENDFGMFIENTTRETGLQNEIGAGWFYWALRASIAKAGHCNSALELNAFCQRIANEINAAVDSGKLAGRFTFSSFLDPDVSNYLPHLPDSLLRVSGYFLHFTALEAESDAGDVPLEVKELYNQAANRRTSLTSYPYSVVRGWLLKKGEKVTGIAVADPQGNLLSDAATFTPRPDVLDHFGIKDADGGNCGFSVAVRQSPQIDSSTVTVTTDRGSRLSFRYKDFLQSNASPGVDYAVDSVSAITAIDRSAVPMEQVRKIYQLVLLGLTVLAGAGGVLLLFLRPSKQDRDRHIAVLILLSAVVPRYGLISLLDASSWIANPRYVFAVMPVFACLTLLICNQALQAATLRLRSREPEKEENTALFATK